MSDADSTAKARKPQHGRSHGSTVSATSKLSDGCAHIILYDADGNDGDVDLEQIDVIHMTDKQLLWIDVDCEDADLVDAVGRSLHLPAAAIAALQAMDTTPRVQNFGDCFHVQVVAVAHQGALKFDGTVVGLVAGANFVLSVHHRPVPFIDQLRERERGETQLGALSAESFTASLLDWHLSTYFDAVSDFELAVERLEVEILSDKDKRCLDDLRNLRRGASRLRRMLAPHRAVFAGMARPDFLPREDNGINVHFSHLDTHYERAMDLVQNTRELMIGSFELFSSQTALRTNESMRVLTFVTVLIGTLAVVAGMLGMNFDAPFFATGATGFWWSLAGMGALSVVAIVIARRWRWI